MYLKIAKKSYKKEHIFFLQNDHIIRDGSSIKLAVILCSFYVVRSSCNEWKILSSLCSKRVTM